MKLFNDSNFIYSQGYFYDYESQVKKPLLKKKFLPMIVYRDSPLSRKPFFTCGAFLFLVTFPINLPLRPLRCRRSTLSYGTLYLQIPTLIRPLYFRPLRHIFYWFLVFHRLKYVCCLCYSLILSKVSKLHLTKSSYLLKLKEKENNYIKQYSLEITLLDLSLIYRKLLNIYFFSSSSLFFFFCGRGWRKLKEKIFFNFPWYFGPF